MVNRQAVREGQTSQQRARDSQQEEPICTETPEEFGLLASVPEKAEPAHDGCEDYKQMAEAKDTHSFVERGPIFSIGSG